MSIQQPGKMADYFMKMGNRSETPRILALIAIVVILNTFCSEPLPSRANCPPGSHPCSDDSTQCCQDTTSSNFQWTIDTLGNHGSTLSDAFILNDSDIWISGNYWIGNEVSYENYSAMHLVNGEPHYVKFVTRNHPYDVLHPQAIWCYSDDDIWIASGWIYHWVGDSAAYIWNDPEATNGFSKVWGNNDHEMYFGGKNSSIIKYDESTLKRIEKPYPDVDIFAISGTPDSNIVFFVAKTPYYELRKSAVYKLSEAGISTLYYSENIDPDGDYGEVLGVKVLADTAYIWTAKALWKYHIYTGESTFSTDDNYQQWGHRGIYTLDGNGPNDLFAIAGITTWFHYNGKRWHYDPWLYGADVQCFGAVIKDDLVVAYGYYNLFSPLGFYAIGRRY